MPDIPVLDSTMYYEDDSGAIMTPATIEWCRDHIADLEVEHVGPGIHFVQEDSGPAIGRWMERQGLVKQPSTQGKPE